MARQYVDIEGLARILPLTRHAIYHATKRREHPLPFKKMGRKLLFDVERVHKWFDRLPGKDSEGIS